MCSHLHREFMSLHVRGRETAASPRARTENFKYASNQIKKPKSMQAFSHQCCETHCSTAQQMNSMHRSSQWKLGSVKHLQFPPSSYIFIITAQPVAPEWFNAMRFIAVIWKTGKSKIWPEGWLWHLKKVMHREFFPPTFPYPLL